MPKRHKMSQRTSQKHFTRNAVRTHRKNTPPASGMPMRGGIRL